MRIIAGSLNQVAETFLHPGYLSASPAHLLEQGGVDGYGSWLVGALASEPAVVLIMGVVVTMVTAIAIGLVRRRLDRGPRKLVACLAGAAIAFLTIGAMSMLLFLSSAPSAAALP